MVRITMPNNTGSRPAYPKRKGEREEGRLEKTGGDVKKHPQIHLTGPQPIKKAHLKGRFQGEKTQCPLGGGEKTASKTKLWEKSSTPQKQGDK